MKKLIPVLTTVILLLILWGCQNPGLQTVEVTLDLNGGHMGVDYLSTQEPDSTMMIQSKNDVGGDTLSLFDRDNTKLRWFYKLFIVFNEPTQLYEVVYKDPMTAAVENLTLPHYDYIIGAHQQLSNPEILNQIMAYTQDINTKLFVDFGVDPNTFTTGELEVKFYTEAEIYQNPVLSLKEPTKLPVPIKEGFRFLGWLYQGKTYFNYPSYTTKDGLKHITFIAQWGSKTMTELETYLDSILPEMTEESVGLPLVFSGFNLEWSSSHPEVISNSGLYKRPYHTTTVILTANITGEVEDTLTFEVVVPGYKSLEGPIASSYIYRGYNTVNDAFFETLDIINTAFITADGQGNLYGETYLSNVQTYILPKAKIYGNWVIMSVAPESSWSTIAASPTLVNTFADNIVSMINQYGFDGVDIDWETPTDAEKTRFTALMKIVYEKVKANNPNHLVTTAITGGIWQPPRYDLNNSKVYLDYINLMTYGMSNGNGQYQNALYRATTYHNTTLLAGRSLSTASIDETVKNFKSSYNIDYQKIIVGVAFYGIKQTRTYDANTQTFGSWVNAGSVYYNNIVLSYLNNNDYIKAYDTRAGVPYILKTDGTEFISYDNPRSIQEKSDYVIREGLGGIMFWEYGTDTSGELLIAIKDGLNK